MKYKIWLDQFKNTGAILKIDNNLYCSIPQDPINTDYQRFIQDVAEQGIEIVEGPDIIEPSYQELRVAEYPSLQDQQDMQYWDQVNGTTVWKDTIEAIKTKYPKTITGGTTVGEVPAWVQEAADNWIFNKQLREYVDALEVLELEDATEEQKEAAQAIVDATPQEVIDAINS